MAAAGRPIRASSVNSTRAREAISTVTANSYPRQRPWFKHVSGMTFLPRSSTPATGSPVWRPVSSSRAAGRLVSVTAGPAGDVPMAKDVGPVELIREVDCGHSLALVDFNKDGHLDIWVAEMRLNDSNPRPEPAPARRRQGRFQTESSRGIRHESVPTWTATATDISTNPMAARPRLDLYSTRPAIVAEERQGEVGSRQASSADGWRRRAFPPQFMMASTQDIGQRAGHRRRAINRIHTRRGHWRHREAGKELLQIGAAALLTGRRCARPAFCSTSITCPPSH
jgi:hypothetical protein